MGGRNRDRSDADGSDAMTTTTLELAGDNLDAQTRAELTDEVNRLRREMNAVILAHYYQYPEIQDVADIVGDSLQLAREAVGVDADVIVLCGVHFMAETAKILNPQTTVLLPDFDAGCSLADGCPPAEFAEFVARHPGHEVVTYVNCSADIKALSDVTVTSSNALDIIMQIPADRKIIFAPDQHLGRYLMREAEREMVLWEGSCEVHEKFGAEQIAELKLQHPDALVAAHPECRMSVLELADHVGSTRSILKFVTESPAAKFIVATEPGIIHQMRKATEAAGKEFIPAPTLPSCQACAECPYMRKNTLGKLAACMRNRTPELTMPAELIAKARKPIERMLAMSR
jgi:quinolinate synthase